MLPGLHSTPVGKREGEKIDSDVLVVNVLGPLLTAYQEYTTFWLQAARAMLLSSS